MMRIGATTRLGLSPFTFLRACRPWRVFAFFYLAKLAECFAQFFLTRPELAEEDVFPGTAFSLFQSGSHKGNPPGKEKENLAI